jgi:hypothetical protein
MPASLPDDSSTDIQYSLKVDEQLISLNRLIGQPLRLEFNSVIHCSHCGRKTKKSFSQGFCYPCMTKLACCDLCIMSPERCHYDAGTCRQPEWGEQFCMTDHIVYLANSSGVKVGITRLSQIPTRWIDQGAIQALPILRVKTRQQSGLVEDVIRQHVADRTNWRAMLKGDVSTVDLLAKRDELLALCQNELNALSERFGLQAIQPITNVEPLQLTYPVEQYPTKITSFNFDKNPLIEGTLVGIKGQYLIFDNGVINIRKFTSYEVTVSY